MPLEDFLKELKDGNKHQVTNLMETAHKHGISHNYSTVMLFYNMVVKTAKGFFKLRRDYKPVVDDPEFHDILKGMNNDITTGKVKK